MGSWTAGRYDPEGSLGEPIFGPGMGPVWTEQHGGAAAVDSTVDSLRYDGWARLVAWRQYRQSPPDTLFTLAASDSVGFDRAGNLTVSGETRWHDPITNRLDSLVAATWTWRYTYDAAGSLTRALGSKGALTEDWRYGYDALGQLRRVGFKAAAWPADSTVARYGYDVLGRRIVKRVYRVVLGGSVAHYRRFVYQGAAVAYETDSTGAIKVTYAWGTGVDDLVGLEDSTGTFYHVVQDQLGSVRGLVKRGGTWRMHQRFTPYGSLLAKDSAGALPTLRYGWTGREYDAESGLYYFRSRSYDPRQRRFTQEDPIGYGGGGNLYAYVGGAVLEATDPSGLYKDWVDMGHGFMPFCTPSGNYLGADGSFQRGGCTATTGGGGGGGGFIDSNNDGLDDFGWFADYAFGRQVWAENGGSQQDWWQLMWALEHGVENVEARQSIMHLFVLGRVSVDDFSALPLGSGVLPDDLGYAEDRRIHINVHAAGHWNTRDWSELAFTLAHEAAHLFFDAPNVYLSADEQCTHERGANRYATQVTGYDLAGNYFPYWISCH